MRNFQDAFETRKRSFVSAFQFSICMNGINKSFLDNYFPKELEKGEVIPAYKNNIL